MTTALFLKKTRIILLLFFFINFNVFAFENRILFKVENEIITTFDVYNHIKYLTMLNPKIQELDYERILEISKNNLIREKVKKKEILNIYKKISLDEDKLDKVIKSIFINQKINNANELTEYLSSFDLSFLDIKEKILIEVFWNQLIYEKFSSKIKIDKEKLRRDILDNEKKIIKSFLLSEILFNIENKTDLEKKILIIEDSIKKNGFKNTALTYSTSNTATSGGNLGWLDENVFSEEIKIKINEIKKGEYTKPILTQSGFLILMVDDIKENEAQIDIEKELIKIINIKANQQLDQFSNIHYNKIEKDTLIEEL